MSNSNSNNSSIDDTFCQDSYYYEIGERSSLIIDFILTPIYFFFGLFGNIVFLLVVFTRTKSDRVYVFQAIIAVCGPPYVVLRTGLVIVDDWMTTWRPGEVGPRWWWTCYGCVWYSAHIAEVMPNIVGVFVQFQVVFMLADRFRALYKPLGYRPPTKRTYVSLCLVSALASVALNSFEFYCNTVQETEDGTAYWIDYEYSKIPAAVYSAYVRSAVLCLCLLTMYGFNVVIPLIYYKTIKSQSLVFTDAQERARRRRMHTLMAVAMCQSVAETVCQTLFIACYVYIALPLECKVSRYPLLVSVVNLGTEISSASNFYVLITFSREFRGDACKYLQKLISWLKCRSDAVVPKS